MNINHIQIGATNIVKAYLGSTIIYQKVMGLVSLFSASQQGFWYEADDISTLYQDSAGTVATTLVGDPIALVKDKSGNNNNAVQTVSAKRSIYNVNPARITLDKVDDEFVITVPTGGWVGTMVLGTTIGTASYEVNLAAGSFLLGQYFTKFDRDIVGVVLRDGSLTDAEKLSTKEYFIGKGAVADYGAVTSFAEFWRNSKEITEFPLIDTSNGTNFYIAWYKCSSLTSFPLLDTSRGTNFFGAWYECSSLTSFPLIDTSSATDMSYAWYGCVSLTNVPANLFDNIKGGQLNQAFRKTNLTQVSIDNILTSLVTSGIATGTRVFYQSGGSAPSVTGTAAIDTLRSRGWTVTVTGAY